MSVVINLLILTKPNFVQVKSLQWKYAQNISDYTIIHAFCHATVIVFYLCTELCLFFFPLTVTNNIFLNNAFFIEKTYDKTENVILSL